MRTWVTCVSILSSVYTYVGRLLSENESVHSFFIPMHRHKALESSFADLKFEIEDNCNTFSLILLK